MMMRILQAILIVAMLPLGCIGQTTRLDTRVSISGFHKFQTRSLFEFLTQRAGIQLKVEGNAFGQQDPEHPTYVGVVAKFTDVPIRFPLSWVLHFSPGISAELKDGVLVLRPSGSQQELSPELRAYEEPAGSWTNSLTPDAVITTRQASEAWDMIQLFEYLSYRLGANNLVIDPALHMQGRTASIALNGRTVRDVMNALLHEANASLRYQGGVLFLTTRTEDAQQRRP